MRQKLPLIFAIRRFALDDGPGIRSTVFFKGCPLSCVWCHNPESVARERETAFFRERCLNCAECRAVCSEGALNPDPRQRINRDRCAGCGRCAERCPTLALQMMGEYFPVQDLLLLLLRDRHFYDASAGGVTFSGGEPTIHFDYLRQALIALKRLDIHTAIQTCGLFDGERFSRGLLPYIDRVYFDIKLVDQRRHRRYTGCGNRVIIDNFVRLSALAREKVTPRVPLVPGITATPDNIRGIAALLRDQGYKSAEFLPYNPAVIGKRQALGKEVPSSLSPLPLSLGQEMLYRELLERFITKGG